MEGDGPIAVECYEIIATLKAAIHTGYYPNVEAVTCLLRGSNPALTQQWLSYARGCVQGSIDYFEEGLEMKARILWLHLSLLDYFLH